MSTICYATSFTGTGTAGAVVAQRYLWDGNIGSWRRLFFTQLGNDQVKTTTARGFSDSIETPRNARDTVSVEAQLSRIMLYR